MGGSDIPKFGEDCQVCAHGFSFAAALESLFEIPDLIVAARRNLKQRDCKSHWISTLTDSEPLARNPAWAPLGRMMPIARQAVRFRAGRRQPGHYQETRFWKVQPKELKLALMGLAPQVSGECLASFRSERGSVGVQAPSASLGISARGQTPRSRLNFDSAGTSLGEVSVALRMTI